jgi:hypothetical protein
MNYSPHKRNYRDYIEAEVEKTMQNLDLQNKKNDGWFIKFLKFILKKLKLCMSFLKWK